jgi:hypothetical protein
MTRPEQDTCAPPTVAVAEEPERDSLFERWLARSPASRQRLRIAPARLQSTPPPEPIGDGLADSWFK